jgi:multidrug efflux pump subunit AcrB
MFRYNGQPAIGLAMAMKKGGNIQEFGEALQQRMDELTARLPVGVGVHMVSDQAEVVQEAVGGFTSALFEAVIIVLVVSFISLGLRAGLVVASRSRWCWRWCSCSWNTAASPCSVCRWAR